MGLIETACDTVDVAVKAINDSKISDILIFRNRHEYPWAVKGNAVPMLKASHLCYSVNNKNFYKFNTNSDVSDTSENELLKMDDIIMAELVDASGNSVCDMSDFLYSVKWTSNSRPSIYECILVNIILHKLCLPTEYLSNCILRVTTLDNPSLLINVSNPLIKDDFLSWNAFVPIPYDNCAIAPKS